MTIDSTAVQAATASLEHWAAALKGPAAHLWSIGLRQVRVEAITATISIVFSYAIASTLLTLGLRGKKANPRYTPEMTGADIAIVVGGAMLAVTVIVTFATMNSVVTALCNPEWAVIQKIISTVPAGK